MESSNQFFAASQVFEQAGETDSRFAELQFRAGRCAERLTNYAAAKAHYERARDADALPFRADAALNSTTREVARRFADRGAKLIDAEAELARQSPHEITGQEFFHDHVHLTFEGNYRLARLLARQVEDSLPSAILRLRQNDWATAVVCEGRLGLTDWNRNAAYEAMLLRFAEAPFTNQLNHASRAQALVEKIMQTRARMHPRVFLDTRAIYEEALAKNSRDHWLSENFAEFLEATGEIEEAIAQWRRVAAALPHHFAAFFHVGRLLRQQAKYPEAIAQLVKALALRPDLADGRLELGQARLDSGQPEAALADFITVRRQHPEDARVHVQVASALAALNRRGEATTSLREAIRLRPPYWEAHYLLGVELAGASHFAAAELEFTEVIRLRPNYASAHFNLAVALAKQARLDQAVAEFQETLRLDPNHQTARQYLQSLKPSPRE